MRSPIQLYHAFTLPCLLLATAGSLRKVYVLSETPMPYICYHKVGLLHQYDKPDRLQEKLALKDLSYHISRGQCFHNELNNDLACCCIESSLQTLVAVYHLALNALRYHGYIAVNMRSICHAPGLIKNMLT